ncbi:MAG: flagellar biosynthesis anti-sigma factor FlgM [Candidatus Accumulibacter sp.]|jgi:negative regulator of flagellin synthesis FlgM|nr:flagellar biosynthesis anti-sigma factor FlgM [Accumulibacter sp.]
MKIESTSTPHGIAYAKDAPPAAAKKASKTSDGEVRLSELASQLQSADESAFDAARVSEIKRAISEGRFVINADAIADRLIASAKELLTHRQD